MILTYEYYIDPELDISHTTKHNVSHEEIVEFFTETNYIKYQRKDKSYVAISKIKNKRYLQIIYRQIKKDYLYIITAYDIDDPYLIEMIESNYKNENY